MILSVERAKWLIDFKDWPIERIEQKLKAIEQTIRSYTNNNFQNRKIRSAGVVSSSKLNVINKLLRLLDEPYQKNQLLLFLMMPCVHLVLNWMQKINLSLHQQ